MQISENGIELLKQYEGLVLFAYDDFDPPSVRRKIKVGDKVHGTLTIGYGHTGTDVKPGMVISKQKAEEFMHLDLGPTELAVSSAVKVPLTQNQFDALVCFAYNIGVNAFRSSTLVRKLNGRDYASVPEELMKWTKSKGKKMNGLVNRRSAEAGLWARGGFVQSSGTAVQKDTPSFVSPQAISAATGVVSALGSGFFMGNGPVQYAFAAVLVIAVLAGGYLYLKKRLSN